MKSSANPQSLGTDLWKTGFCQNLAAPRGRNKWIFSNNGGSFGEETGVGINI
jgi:hypothetical protein